MNNQIFNFLKKSYPKDPFSIDRLFVSAYLKENNLLICNNKLLKTYIITEKDEIEYQSLLKFISLIHINNEVLDFETLINLFEFVISPADRIINGAIYTPAYIREYIISSSLNQWNNLTNNIKIADLSCGCGSFLLSAAESLYESGLPFQQIFANNIFGVDIQEYAINRTKVLLSLLAISNGEDCDEFTFNLFIGNTLEFKWNKHINIFHGFDIIVGNPPYVRLRNLDTPTKTLLKEWEVCKTGLTDLYIPFFQIAIENLAPNGIVGYITMNSFFKSLNGRALREYFHTKSLQFRIIDFGFDQVFKSKNTYTCICIIKKTHCNYIEYAAIKSCNLTTITCFDHIEYQNLNAHKGWNLKINSIISIIENTGTSLGKVCTTRHGIATLKNNVYIFKPYSEDQHYYHILVNNKTYLIEKSICRAVINPNRIKDVYNIKTHEEVLIFPYECINNKVIPIDEDTLTNKYPYTYNYLCDQREILSKRDNGNGRYSIWYLFGRTQSLNEVEYKLFFPKIANKPPRCSISNNRKLYYYNGQAIIAESYENLEFIKKIIESRLFWYYIVNTSKPYSSGYYSLNGNYIKNFGVYNFTEDEKSYIINESDKELVDTFIEKKYNITLRNNTIPR